MTTNARARQAIPPSRNASGVEPPATAATPVTLSSIAIPGAITDTEIAMASHKCSEPCASSPVAAPGMRSGLVLAMSGGPLNSFGHEDGVIVQDVVEGERCAFVVNDPIIEPNVHGMRSIGVHGFHVGKFGVEQVTVATVPRAGDVRAEAAFGHEADLLGPGPNHLPHFRDLFLSQLAREAEQHDVLQSHRGSLVFARVGRISRTRSTRA